MNMYEKEGPFIVGLDFDGTITSAPLGGNNYPAPSKGFEKFYNWALNNNLVLCIHTARDLNNQENRHYIKAYLTRYGFTKIYFPSIDGKTIKNLDGDIKNWPYKISINTKLVCSCFIDDLNIGIPKHKNGLINWSKVIRLVKHEIKLVDQHWRKL